MVSSFSAALEFFASRVGELHPGVIWHHVYTVEIESPMTDDLTSMIFP
jgi:hypothetical protein